MLQFYEKRSWRLILKSWWFVVLLGVLTLLLTFVVYDRYLIDREMSHRRAEAEEKLQHLEERKMLMQDKVDYLESERGIEAEMRRNFDVAQPGEQVVIIIDDKSETSSVTPLIPPPPPDTPPWYIFWR